MNNNEPKGQILPGSRFGDMLTELAKQSEFIVEIGSWHGLGSTKCLANGLVRPTQRMWTFEKDKEVSAEAASYYSDPRIRFIASDLLSYRFDMPANVDLALLDGDDIDTEYDWEWFCDRCKVVALDDTNERKNRLQRAIILNDPVRWSVLADELGDRYGWLIARRR